MQVSTACYIIYTLQAKEPFLALENHKIGEVGTRSMKS